MPIQAVGREEGRMIEVLAGGAGVQALGGIAAIVLTIIGLSNVAQKYMLAVSAIVVGASLLAMAVAAGAEYRQAAAEEASAVDLGGASVGVLGGIAAIVLGILALLNIAPDILCAIAAIVAGAALALSAGVPAQIGTWRAGMAEEGIASSLGSGTLVLVGLAAIVLGVLAVVGIARPTLTLVAFLASGAGLLVSGFAVGGTAVANR